MENPILFIVGYILNITLYSFSFINISLIVARKHHNIIAAVIVSILSYIGIQLFLEVVVNALICQKLLHKSIGHLFNIMNLYTYSDQFGILALLVFSILVFVVTCLGVIFSYKNKEKLIIDCEKNN